MRRVGDKTLPHKFLILHIFKFGINYAGKKKGELISKKGLQAMKKTMKRNSRDSHKVAGLGEGKVIHFPHKKETVSFSSSQDSLKKEEKAPSTQDVKESPKKEEKCSQNSSGRVEKEGLESFLDRLSRLEKTQKRMVYYLKEMESFFLG